MYSSHQSFPSPPPSPTSPRSRPNKVISQRQYRANEGECFNILRELIKDLTGEDLQKRSEILRKAIDLLLAASEIKKSRELRDTPSTSYGSIPGDMAPVHMGYIAQPLPSSWSPSGHSSVSPSSQATYYHPQSHSQQDLFPLDMNPAFSHDGPPSYDENWPGYSN